MPINPNPTYKGPPKVLFNGHLETILPDLFAAKIEIDYQRERITLSDGDFLDLDWHQNQNDHLLILTHGLVGSSDRPYILKAAKFYSERNWDILAWNCRSCSGEINKALRFYHHGDINDIHEVIQHVNAHHDYRNIVLMGYSMGGSITLKYMGVKGDDAPANVKAGVAFCTPFDVEYCSNRMDLWENYLYRRVFMKEILEKFAKKAVFYPDVIDLSLQKQIKTWRDFDEIYTVPIHGYASADDFYADASSMNFIAGTARPTLAVNSANDPIIPPTCIPYETFEKNKSLFLEVPKRGGHVGFSLKNEKYHSWMDYRSYAFLEEYLDL